MFCSPFFFFLLCFLCYTSSRCRAAPAVSLDLVTVSLFSRFYFHHIFPLVVSCLFVMSWCMATSLWLATAIDFMQSQLHWNTYCTFPPSPWWASTVGTLGVGPHRSRCPHPAGGWGSGGCCSRWRFRWSATPRHSHQQRKGTLRRGRLWPTSLSEPVVCQRLQRTARTGSGRRLRFLHSPGSGFQAELWMETRSSIRQACLKLWKKS